MERTLTKQITGSVIMARAKLNQAELKARPRVCLSECAMCLILREGLSSVHLSGKIDSRKWDKLPKYDVLCLCVITAR
jgi:hypothetical protein